MVHANAGTVRLLVIGLIAVLATAVAQADDRVPPPWRGTPLGVEGHWNQATGWNVQVYSSPTLPGTVWPQGPFGPSPVTGTPGDVWQVYFPNWVDELPLKIGRIQIYWGQPLTEFPIPQIDITGFDNNSPVPGNHDGGNSIPGPAGGVIGWYWDFTIQPNPDYEIFNFGLPFTLPPTQIDIDTASIIPEPASISLIGLGAVALLRRRRV